MNIKTYQVSILVIIMSRTFGRFFKPFFKMLNEEQSGFGTIAVTIIGVTTISVNCVYSFTTCETKNIIVKDKLMFSREGNTEFIVKDTEDKLYNVNNSLWYWKWDSLEDWTNIQTNKEYIIKYYGWRVPLLGIFPNIVETKCFDENVNANQIMNE
jgi:hypothetical protein